MNPRTLERWEQGRSRPNDQAAVLIWLLRVFPDTLGPTLSGRRRTLRAMKSDTALKELFRMRAEDLLPLTNDAGARLEGLGYPVNVQATSGAVDFALCLSRGREQYVRHLEFQSTHRAAFAHRFFRYAAALTRHFERPVLTTVLYVRPPAPSAFAYQQVLAAEGARGGAGR